MKMPLLLHTVAFAAVLSIQPVPAQSEDYLTTGAFKVFSQCKGEFEERTRCMIAQIKALEARMIAAEARIREIETTLTNTKADVRITSLERNTIKANQVVSLIAEFRQQCLHWIDTAQAPYFVPCGSGPDPRDERIILRPQ
jgi:hypothetical protein